MKAGDEIMIKATVLRVDETRIDTQTADGQLIQTSPSNIVETPDKFEPPIAMAGGAIEDDVKKASTGRKNR